MNGTTRIVVGVDHDTRLEVLDWAAREASLRDAAVHVVHVWDPLAAGRIRMSPDPAPAAEEIVHHAVEHLGALMLLSGEVVQGDAGAILVALSTTAALLVLGSSRPPGNGGLLLGGVAQHCVRQAHCPVTVVPQGWQCALSASGPHS